MRHRFTIKIVEHMNGSWPAFIYEAGQVLRSTHGDLLMNVLHEVAVLLVVHEAELDDAA